MKLLKRGEFLLFNKAGYEFIYFKIINKNNYF